MDSSNPQAHGNVRTLMSQLHSSWEHKLESESPPGVAAFLGLRGKLLRWMVQAVPEIDEVIAQRLASNSRFPSVFQYVEDPKIEQNLEFLHISISGLPLAAKDMGSQT